MRDDSTCTSVLKEYRMLDKILTVLCYTHTRISSFGSKKKMNENMLCKVPPKMLMCDIRKYKEIPLSLPILLKFEDSSFDTIIKTDQREVFSRDSYRNFFCPFVFILLLLLFSAHSPFSFLSLLLFSLTDR